jgi:hypothetical protein
VSFYREHDQGREYVDHDPRGCRGRAVRQQGSEVKVTEAEVTFVAINQFREKVQIGK